MEDPKEQPQQVSVKFCFLLGRTAAETVTVPHCHSATVLREAFKDKAVGKT
jgi:hypothetical protein